MNIELIKEASLSHLLQFLERFDMCLKIGSIPDEWEDAVISPMFIEDNRSECSNYRGISLLNSSYKIYCQRLSDGFLTLLFRLSVVMSHYATILSK
jgi:hypothetical protein